jgi:hypothetical protein
VTVADIAPTLARLVGFPDFQAPDADPMEEVIQRGAPKPRLIVVLVWDAGGRYVLEDLWPGKWPNLKALIPQGIWYENAAAGSTPSNTSPIHANIGTGTFPYRHGMVDKYVRFPDGDVVQPWTRGPDALLQPTFADHYGYEAGDRAVLGLVATLTGHMGMLGRGSLVSPKYRPVAVLRERGTGAEVQSWLLPDPLVPYYRFPSYVNDLPPLSRYFHVADAIDGKVDGTWRGRNIGKLVGGFATPARIPYQTRAIEEVIKREGFGHHEWTDILFLNYKLIDQIGHMYWASSKEMGDSVRIQDADLPRFMGTLDRLVGKGRWVLCLTADHGHCASPDVGGGFPIRADGVKKVLDKDFGGSHPDSLLGKIRPGWLYVDTARLQQGGFQLKDMARELAALTEANLAERESILSPGERDSRVFASAFPHSALTRLR